MTFCNYIDSTKAYVEDKDKVFHTLVLVSDTANLLEKLKYFKNENSLIIAEIGDVIFRAFALMEKLNISISEDPANDPIDLEEMKKQTDTLNKKFPISEIDLLQSIIMEQGIISNIITENMKYNIVTFTQDDKERLKKSLFSYVLFMLILVCKFNFSIDKVLEFNVNTKKVQNVPLNSNKA